MEATGSGVALRVNQNRSCWVLMFVRPSVYLQHIHLPHRRSKKAALLETKVFLNHVHRKVRDITIRMFSSHSEAD